MAIEYTEFVATPRKVHLIKVSAENIEELAVWMGADSYSVEKILVGGEREVVFSKREGDRGYPRKIARAMVGEYLMKIPEGIDEHLRDTGERFFAVTQKEVDEFINQQRDYGNVDLSSVS